MSAPTEKIPSQLWATGSIAAFLGFLAGVLAGLVWAESHPPPRYKQGDRVVLVGLYAGGLERPTKVVVRYDGQPGDSYLPTGTHATVVGSEPRPPGSLLGPEFRVRIEGLASLPVVHQNNLIPDSSADRP